MTKWPRKWRPNSGQHLISRFLDRRFHLLDDVDRREYIRFVTGASPWWDWQLFSWALMSSHVHLGAIAGQSAPEAFFRRVHGRFARNFHKRHGGLGPVIAHRPTNHEISNGALRRLVAYHHLNPVRAGVVKHASESRWTSHRCYLRLDPAPPWLDVEWALALLGFNDTQSGRTEFDEFVRGCPATRPQPIHKTTGPLAGSQRRRRPSPQRQQELYLLCSEIGGPNPADIRRLYAAAARETLGATFRQIANHLRVSESAAHRLVHRPLKSARGVTLRRNLEKIRRETGLQSQQALAEEGKRQ